MVWSGLWDKCPRMQSKPMHMFLSIRPSAASLISAQILQDLPIFLEPSSSRRPERRRTLSRATLHPREGCRKIRLRVRRTADSFRIGRNGWGRPDSKLGNCRNGVAICSVRTEANVYGSPAELFFISRGPFGCEVFVSSISRAVNRQSQDVPLQIETEVIATGPNAHPKFIMESACWRSRQGQPLLVALRTDPDAQGHDRRQDRIAIAWKKLPRI